MKLINRYVIKQLCVTSVYALLALLALYSFFDVMDQVGSVGHGSYTSSKMIAYVLMQMPAHAYELMPLAVLIGGLVALNQLSTGSELTVMKSSGISTKKLIIMLLQFGLVFAVCTALLGEWLAPSISQRADNMRTTAVEGKVSTGGQGVWLKEGQNIINVKEVLPDHTLLGIKIWQHNDQLELTQTVGADRAKPQAKGQWLLENVKTSTLEKGHVQVKSEPQQPWQITLPKKLLDVLLVDPSQMSLSDLTAYLSHLKANHQQTATYEIEWWRKLIYPLAAMVMALVALAFTPQSSRSGNMGMKLFGGVCLGLLFHFSGRLFGFTSQLYGVPPFLAAVLPTLLFALMGVYLIHRQEKR